MYLHPLSPTHEATPEKQEPTLEQNLRKTPIEKLAEIVREKSREYALSKRLKGETPESDWLKAEIELIGKTIRKKIDANRMINGSSPRAANRVRHPAA